MFCFHRETRRTGCESGQVLAEAVVVMLLLVVMLLGVHVSGSRQFKWARQWLAAQIAADALMLGHARLPSSARISDAHKSRWYQGAIRDFGLGHSQWKTVTTKGQYAQVAWRLAGAGQASSDTAVTRRIERAARSWRNTEFASKVVVHALMPTIKAVEMPWDERGSATDWLGQWEGSTPPAYLNRAHE